MKIKKAFTLIELLVVVAIIAVLVALLLPALSSAKSMAVQVQCSSNLKTAATASMFYAQEYNDAFPFYFFGYTPYVEYTWGSILSKLNYVKDPNMVAFRCPSIVPPQYLLDNWDIYKHYFMYGVDRFSNSNIILNTGDSGLPAQYDYYNGIKFSTLTSPSAHFFMADTVGSSPNQYTYGWQLFAFSRNHYLAEALIQLRHRNVANISFADGHVGGLNESDIKSSYGRSQEGETRYFPGRPELEVLNAEMGLKRLGK
jgi:prepilin-type N-terminal cleavage/methylation domain-containing protein/prepilin-type processing-associated H-X9-DG protein